MNHNLSILDVLPGSGFEQKGGYLRGSHPFHGSSTGNNLAVSPQENFAYCFRHNVGGGPLNWLALKEGILGSCEDLEHGLSGKDFIETCKIANRKYGCEIDIEDVDEEEMDMRSSVFEALSEAAEKCHGQLKQDAERWNRIKDERCLDDEDLEQHLIGYWSDAVTDYLVSQYSPEVLLNSGLFKISNPDHGDSSETGVPDSFKEFSEFESHVSNPGSHSVEDLLYPIVESRVTFPYTKHGRVHYMIGRRTKEQEEYWYGQVGENREEIRSEILDNPETGAETMSEAEDNWVSRKCGKYVKICETDYNNHIIWREFDDRDELVITEGIYDAISVAKSGCSVASPITTRFNDKDIGKVVEVCKSFDNVYLVFDGDTAGKQGQRKTAEELVRNRTDPVMVTLESGTDFDDWTTRHGYAIDSRLAEGSRFINREIDSINDAEPREQVELKEELFRLLSDWKRREVRWMFKELDGRKKENRKEYREICEEVREERELEQRENRVFDDDDSDSGSDTNQDAITDSLSVPHSDHNIKLNPRPRLIVNRLRETAFSTSSNRSGTIDKTREFKIYEVQFGQGDEETTYNLLVKPSEIINKGEQKLPIKKADLHKSRYKDSDFFQEQYEQKRRNEDDFSKSYEEYLDGLEGSRYLELQTRLDPDSIDTVEELGNDTVLSLVQEYLRKAYRTDPKLRSVMYAKIVQHDKSRTNPGDTAKYAPHTQMWTNTKVGKSHTSDRVGRRFEDATPAGLLGYADTDGKRKGIIDGLDCGVFIDEFDFGSSSQQLNDHLLSLMEQGNFEQVKAGHSIKTRFYGSLTYMANPKDGDIKSDQDEYLPGDGFMSEYEDDKSSFELVSKFEELIQVLGMNIQAMASRFGVIVFDDNMETARPMDDAELEDSRFEKLETFVEWVQREVSRQYTDIESELDDWMETRYPDEYVNRIEDLAEDTQNEKVEKFWKNHPESFRHARGQALRMAVYQNIGSVVNDDYSLEEICDAAEEQFEIVKQINLASLENMTDATDSDMMRQRARATINEYSPKYLRLFMKSLIVHQQRNENSVGQRFGFSELREVFLDIREELPGKDVSEESRYWKWSRVSDMVSENLNKKRLDLEQEFGVEILRRNQTDMFRVKVPERFKPFFELDVVSGSAGGDQEGGDGSSGDAPSGDGSGGSSEGGVEDSSGDDVGDGSDDEVDYRIDGEYRPTPDGVKQLIEDHEPDYSDGVPEKHLKIYFGREYKGRRQKELMESLDALLGDGEISDWGDSYFVNR